MPSQMAALTITEVMYQPAPGKAYQELNISAQGQRLKDVNNFTYLGSTLSRNITIDDELCARIANPALPLVNYIQMSGTEQASLCSQNSKSIVITIFLYACETWTVYKRHAKKLNHFHTVSLRKLLNIRRQDRIPDTEVLTRAGMPSIFTILAQAQLRWTGHVARMPDHRIPKQLLYGELLTGKRRQGGQKKGASKTI